MREPARAAIAVMACFAAAFPATADDGSAPSSTASVFEQADSMLEDLEEIMGFGSKRPVRLETIGKAEFRALYRRKMREDTNPQDMRNEMLFLKLFGLVPAGFDYEKTVLDLMSEQAWALYDIKKRILYLADWAPPEAREYALVHELVHAVDDQNFNLRRFVAGARESEEQLARLAVMEGQASWVMTEWVMRQSERTLLGNRILAITTASATRFEAEQFPVFESTPLYFKQVLLFPYTDGLLFQHDMVDRFGEDGLKRVYERPPANTQQILQPELYLKGFDPGNPAMPHEKAPKGFKRVYDGTFGQLDHQILLDHHLGEDNRDELLDKWRGARFEILENRRDGNAMLRYVARWEDPEAAREYYHLYRQVCERKWEGLRLVDTGGDRCEGMTEAGFVSIEVAGNIVGSVEGLPAESSEGEACCGH